MVILPPLALVPQVTTVLLLGGWAVEGPIQSLAVISSGLKS